MISRLVSGLFLHYCQTFYGIYQSKRCTVAYFSAILLQTESTGFLNSDTQVTKISLIFCRSGPSKPLILYSLIGNLLYGFMDYQNYIRNIKSRNGWILPIISHQQLSNLNTIKQQMKKQAQSQIIADEKFADTLEYKFKHNLWNVRKQVYEQVLDLIDQLHTPKDAFFIGGKSYTPMKLVKLFEDLVDEQHPTVLLIGLDCVTKLLQQNLCSGKTFVKLLDKGFDRFPLRVNRGKQIMHKFAQIIELISPQASFLSNKISNNNNEKCVMFTLEIISLLNVQQLLPKVKQISQKHPKKAVKQVAKQIYQQMMESQEEEAEQEKSQENDSRQTNIEKQTSKKKIQQKTEKSYVPSKSDLAIIQKLPHYEQLNISSKQYQKYSDSLLQLAPKLQSFPQNLLTNLSHVLRLMIEGSNFVINCNGIKTLKILIDKKSNLIPRSYPLLFLFDKFKLHSSNQINFLLFDLADSLLKNEGRVLDLLQAIIDGSSSKKANIKYGCVMLLVRAVCIISSQEDLFQQFFQNSVMMNLEYSPELINRMKKMLIKSFDLLYGHEKKYDQILNKVRFITLTSSTVIKSSQKHKIAKISSKVHKFPKQAQTKLPENMRQTTKQQIGTVNSMKKSSLSSTSKKYRSINPQETLNYILELAANLRVKEMKAEINKSLSQINECIQENRFQLFYYAELIDNFIKKYEADEQTLDVTSEFMINFLTKVSSIGKKQNILRLKQKEERFINLKNIEAEGISMILKICLCDLFLGKNQLIEILDNLSGYGVDTLILQSLPRIQGKVKKKNRKIVIEWIDANVPHELLCNQLFQLMEKIEHGKYVGEQGEVEKIKFFKENGKQSKIHIPYQSNNLYYEDLSQIEHKNQPSAQRTIIEDQQYLKSLKTSRKDEEQPLSNHSNSLKNEDQFHYEQSNIHYNQSNSIQRFNYKKLKEEQLGYSDQISQKDEDIDKEEKNQKSKQFDEIEEKQEGDDENEQKDVYLDIEHYKEYIKKIRENYLPKKQQNSIQDVQDQSHQEVYDNFSAQKSETFQKEEFIQKKQDNEEASEDKFMRLQERLKSMKEFQNKLEQKSEASIDGNEKEGGEEANEEQEQAFQYKVINASKLSYMLKSTANPYSHLRNQVLIPFKNHSNKPYFLKELTYFLTYQNSQIINKFPQPYNSVLLLIILLFAQIQSNKQLIKPLQQLYEYMASLCSTNDFLKTIISLFHSVIEETPSRLRAFLITILTKSVSRLMVFVEDPVALLRDLSQFYNIGENVYFEMYEAEYRQIKKAIQGQALQEVVEKALVQEGEHLMVIVESWFETQLKTVVKEYIKGIIEENGEQDKSPQFQ